MTRAAPTDAAPPARPARRRCTAARVCAKLHALLAPEWQLDADGESLWRATSRFADFYRTMASSTRWPASPTSRTTIRTSRWATTTAA